MMSSRNWLDTLAKLFLTKAPESSGQYVAALHSNSGGGSIFGRDSGALISLAWNSDP